MSGDSHVLAGLDTVEDLGQPSSRLTCGHLTHPLNVQHRTSTYNLVGIWESRILAVAVVLSVLGRVLAPVLQRLCGCYRLLVAGSFAMLATLVERHWSRSAGDAQDERIDRVGADLAQ